MCLNSRRELSAYRYEGARYCSRLEASHGAAEDGFCGVKHGAPALRLPVIKQTDKLAHERHQRFEGQEGCGKAWNDARMHLVERKPSARPKQLAQNVVAKPL